MTQFQLGAIDSASGPAKLRFMGHLAANALEVRVLWASRHQWPAGQEYDGPCYSNALWLMLEGETQVWGGQENWTVKAGEAFIWPKDRPRRVLTRQGASWLSLGLEVTTPGNNDILGLLPLPVLRALEPADSLFLCSWLEQLVSIRQLLVRATPEKQKVDDYFKSVDIVTALRSYENWVDQVVAERPSHYDLVEDGLARAVVAWCWSLWGSTDLEHALHHHSPLWLQTALEKIRERPSVTVQELAHASGFSPAQFRRSFHQELGQSPREYLQRQRLEIARRLLETTDTPIATIAAHTGFASVPHFIHLWKEKSGLSPLQYRLSQKEARI